MSKKGAKKSKEPTTEAASLSAEAPITQSSGKPVVTASSGSPSPSGAAPKNITVIGVGRLGLCSALCLERAGFNVLGVDVFESYVEALNNKSFKSSEPRLEEFLLASKNFRATVKLEEGIAHADVIILLVDTPSTGGKNSYDHSKVNRLLADFNKRKVQNKHIVIGCTIIPGYSATVGTYLLRDCVNTTLNYNPEFIAQGDIINGYLNPDMVLIGEGSKEAGDVLQAIYEKTVQNKPQFCRMSVSSAEITKLSVNCFVTMKISYANQIGDIADRTPGADKKDILSAVGKDSRVGGKYLKAGYGYGGPCFPRDNRALGDYAVRLGLKPLLMQATDEYNVYHANLQIQAELAKPQDSFVFDNIGYKDHCPVPIIEESQKLVIAEALARAGRDVLIRDKSFLITATEQEYGRLFRYETITEYS